MFSSSPDGNLLDKGVIWRTPTTHRVKKWLSLLLVLAGAVCAWGCQTPEVIRDVREFPQDHFVYLAADNPVRPLAEYAWQEERERVYLQNFFLPWRQETPRFTVAEVEAAWRKIMVASGKGSPYGRKCRRRLRRAVSNAGLDNYPNASWKGITVAAIDLRHLPLSPSSVVGGSGRPETGKGIFLDRLQVSAVAPGTPVHVSHISRDRAWVLVETGFAVGWTQSKGLAAVFADFINLWERGPQVAIIRDKIPFYDAAGVFLYRVPLGSSFPLAEAAGETLEIRVPVRDRGGNAQVRRVVLEKGTAALRPLPLTTGNLARLANELLGDPYGWGGRNDRRDCSSLIRDLYSPFGIWLPRHSADQAREGGRYVDLSGLANGEKKQAIMAQGVPYLTLLWLKGHIMIYIGFRNGEPLVFHNFLTIKTMNDAGRVGKKIVGRASITTLYPGREFQGAADPDGPYLGPLRGMTFIGPPAPASGG